VLPVDAPVGYHLVGVSRLELEGTPGAAVIYTSDRSAEATTVMLFVRLSEGAKAAPAQVAVEHPLRELTWGADGLDYAVVGPVAEDQLKGFAP
jgi:anti-sigma factor RsiW